MFLRLSVLSWNLVSGADGFEGIYHRDKIFDVLMLSRELYAAENVVLNLRLTKSRYCKIAAKHFFTEKFMLSNIYFAKKILFANE